MFDPAIIWIWIFYCANRYKREPIRYLILFFIAGMCCGMIALFMTHIIEKYSALWSGSIEQLSLFGFTHQMTIYRYGFWFMVGFNEEFSKLLVLMLFLFPTSRLKEPFDGILYAVVVSLGFATIENYVYLGRHGTSVLVLRSLVTLPAHIFMSIPMGFFVAKSKLIFVRYQNMEFVPLFSFSLIMTGFLSSATLHGLYDIFIDSGMENHAYLLIIILAVFSVYLIRHSMKYSIYKFSL